MMTELKTNIKKLPVVLLTMVIIATAMIVSGCGQTVIDLKESKILDVDLQGFDGHGKVVISVDEDNLKSLKKEYRDNDNYKDIKELLDDLTFELEDPDVNGTLSNGDSFNVVAKYDEDLAEEANVVLKNTTITCEVKDKLSEGTVIDAFAGVKIEYYGDNGNAYAFVNSDDCDELVDDNNIYFEIDGDNDDLKNGDTIVVLAKSYNDLEDDGYYLKEESKEYTVEGLTGARTTLEGVDLTDIAEDMYEEAEERTEDAFDLAYYDYTYNSGKKRDLNSFDFKYTPSLELVKYAYVYDEDDLSYSNGLVAYYKLTTTIECTSDQYGYEDDDNLMKKGDKDTGVTYIVITSSALKITADNKVEDDYIYYSFTDGISIEECDKELDIDDYSIEYYDKDFKVINDTATATEPATEKSTEKSTEKTTEESTDAEKSTEAATEKATTKKAS